MSHTPEPNTHPEDVTKLTGSWTLEPWKFDPTSEHIYELHGDMRLIARVLLTNQSANAARIVACVNGCTGLNPAAYRQVVEALQAVETFLLPLEADAPDSLSKTVVIVQQALALAEAQQGGEPT